MSLLIRRARDLTARFSRMDMVTHCTVRLNRCETASTFGDRVDASLRPHPWFKNSCDCESAVCNRHRLRNMRATLARGHLNAEP